MKKEGEVTTIKCAVLAFCFSILTLISACAAAPAEASGTQTGHANNTGDTNY